MHVYNCQAYYVLLLKAIHDYIFKPKCNALAHIYKPQDSKKFPGCPNGQRRSCTILQCAIFLSECLQKMIASSLFQGCSFNSHQHHIYVPISLGCNTPLEFLLCYLVPYHNTLSLHLL